jgi:outer membrane immunogenic protein
MAMKLTILGGLTVSALLVAAPLNTASAADMALKAPPLAPAPVYSWTGFYVGANVGYSWGRSNNDWNFFAQNAVNGSLNCSPIFNGGLNAFCATGSDSNKLNGAIGGLQTGYNWQIGSFLAGIETDFQMGDQTFVTNFSTGPGNSLGTLSAAYTEKLRWLGTTRGRVGVTLTDRWLVYATGGLAYGEVQFDGSATSTGNGPTCSPPLGGICPLAGWSNSITKAGWTIGGGLEGAIGNNLSLKVEYLHVDLGSVNTAFTTLPNIGGGYGGLGPTSAGIPAAAGSGTVGSRIIDEIVRVGLNYKFGYAAAPAVYK